jgi:hypothetical protein
MARFKRCLSVLFLGLVAAIGGVDSSSGGEAFRVDTELFQNQDKKPFSEQLTIFTAGGTVYDFCLTAPQEVTVFDPRRGVFTLLNEQKQIKATVTTQELLDFCLAFETQAAQEKHTLFAFCAAPQFETTEKEIDRNGQTIIEMRLTAKPLTYVAEGQRFDHLEAVKAYRHFADWCARLNATCGNPPAARLELNQALADRDLLPLEITRTIPPDLPLGKKLETRSQHRVNWALSREDQKKIDQAGNMMAQFQLVSYDEYRRIPKTDASKQAKR